MPLDYASHRATRPSREFLFTRRVSSREIRALSRSAFSYWAWTNLRYACAVHASSWAAETSGSSSALALAAATVFSDENCRDLMVCRRLSLASTDLSSTSAIASCVPRNSAHLVSRVNNFISSLSSGSVGSSGSSGYSSAGFGDR